MRITVRKIAQKHSFEQQNIEAAYKSARAHRWYMSARLITLNGLYSFDPHVSVTLDPFVDVIGRHYRQPAEGLGF